MSRSQECYKAEDKTIGRMGWLLVGDKNHGKSSKIIYFSGINSLKFGTILCLPALGTRN